MEYYSSRSAKLDSQLNELLRNKKKNEICRKTTRVEGNLSKFSAVIDNEKILLSDELARILPKTEQASIAVGYFFISGFAQIMDSLEIIESSDDPNHVLRLLISPTTNRATAEALLANNESTDATNRKIRDVYNSEEGKGITKDQVRKTLEYMPQTNNDQKAATKLRDLIRKKKIQIKVYTKEQLHAKAYIFKLRDEEETNLVAIVGSSNLSISGITEHTELNLRTVNGYEVEDVMSWFDRHWNDENCQEFTSEIADIIDESWTGKKRMPDEVYHKALSDAGRYIEFRSNNNEKTRELYDFQKAAVSDALDKLENYGGVIIADVVGTGKSYIGSAILKYFKDTHKSHPLIICPPHLIPMWEQYMNDFEVYGSVLSRYKIGMDDTLLSKYDHCDVILIDESHNFRNKTDAYDALFAFMEDKTDEARVIMLSATPISNTIKDLKNQLNLFPEMMRSQIPPLNDVSLDEYFKGLENEQGVTPEGVEKIQELLKHILIRRTRTQILEKYAKKDGKRHYLEADGKRKYFPERNLTNPEEYDGDKVYNDSFEIIEESIKNLKAARYTAGKYIKKEYLLVTHKDYKKYSHLADTTKHMGGLIKTSLLKRMESSIMAFSTSVDNYKSNLDEFKRQLKKGKVAIGKDFQEAIRKKVTQDEKYVDIYDEFNPEKELDSIKSEYDTKAFDVEGWLKDIDDDIDQFAKMKGRLVDKTRYTQVDDKLHTLIKLLEEMPTEKILIFSESAVTTEYITEYMKKKIPREIAQIDSSLGEKDKRSRIQLFDPQNNNYTLKNNEKDIDILISTDVLSEGVNLQAGKTVINYDFHWNPVRLIQRVGRIDRIGTDHESVDVINFLPTTKIDKSLSLQAKVNRKISTIKKIIGHDQQILNSDEDFDSSAVSSIYNKEKEVLDSELKGILNIPESKSDQDTDKLKNDKDRLEQVKKMPYGIRCAVGTGKLVIACEASERIQDQKNNIVLPRKFKKYYEIFGKEATQITESQFLKHLGDNVKQNSVETDSSYNEFVATGWNQFEREVKYTRKLHTLKHQYYFERKLRGMSKEDQKRASILISFVTQNMIANHQPYKKLAELHKKIDKTVNADDNMILTELEKLYEKYADVKYQRIISKPKILYSMMVNR